MGDRQDFEEQKIDHLDVEALKKISASMDTMGLVSREGRVDFSAWSGFVLHDGWWGNPAVPILKAIAPHIYGWAAFRLPDGTPADLCFQDGKVFYDENDSLCDWD